MATAKQLDDITKCPICTEVYTDPRVLPCVHTYCLKCIETWSKDKQPGNEMACPLCRKEFTLPSNGVACVPKNFFVNNMLQMKELSSVESKTSPCEACSGDEESETEVQNVASVYCDECEIKICHQCERVHKASKLTRSHNVIEIGEKARMETQKMPLNYCDQHEDENLKIYCFDCKLTICTMCNIKSHNGHTCSDINEVVGDFRKQMTDDVDNIAAGVEKCKELLQSVEREKNDFTEQVSKIGIEIREKAEQLKEMIDVHREKLMNELSSMKQKRMEEIGSLREEIERQLLSMESYKKYVDEVRQKGTACDIARAASGLHDRAVELLMFGVIDERTLADLGHALVTFTSSNHVTDDVNKTLGQLHLNVAKNAVKSATPTLTHVIPSQGKNGVSAVTSLGDDVFVARYNCNQQVEVYDAVTLTLQRRVTVSGLGGRPVGLAACPNSKCLYASDYGQDRVYRVKLSGSNAVKKWSVASSPRGLSVNSEQNLIVACLEASKLQEYTTHGSLVREICLHAGVTQSWPYHAIQLSTGDYVVSQNTSPGVVSVVRVDGQIVRIYGQSEASDAGHMKRPTSLAVTKNDDILVVGKGNTGILLINSSVGSIQEMALSVDGGMHGPRGLCLDESRGRLYIGELDGDCRVLVFDGVYV